MPLGSSTLAPTSDGLRWMLARAMGEQGVVDPPLPNFSCFFVSIINVFILFSC